MYIQSPKRMDHMHEISFNQVYDSKTVKFLDEEFPRSINKCYLDHAGTTLYSNFQIEKICENLTNNVYPNPHTASGAGNETLDIIERTRHRQVYEFCYCIDLFFVI